MQQDPNEGEDIKPDLKHDTMNFSAPTDGEDPLDTDDEDYEEEDITEEELELLEDDPDNEAAALNAVETDSLADDTIMPEEDWLDDAVDPDDEEGEEANLR
ncbi:MAG: hypothetical protein H7X88_12255 [Gloeobacteraceae cyanobacterium ES-bin-316]|nr:hypothetical protein [Ferruginibacter sp.]